MPVTLQADIIALNAQNHPVLIVEVKHHFAVSDMEWIKERFDFAMQQQHIEYAMLVDLHHILVFRQHDDTLSEPLLNLPTADVLSAYDTDFKDKTIREAYMITLLEAWIRDIAYNWRSQEPPYIEQMNSIGLAQQLHEGTTLNAVTLPLQIL